MTFTKDIKLGDDCKRGVNDIKFVYPDTTPEQVETTIYMYDDYGDGWNGAEMIITDSGGSVVFQDALQDGDFKKVDATFIAEDHTIEITSGNYDYEIAWAIVSKDNKLLHHGTAPTTETFDPTSEFADPVLENPYINEQKDSCGRYFENKIEAFFNSQPFQENVYTSWITKYRLYYSENPMGNTVEEIETNGTFIEEQTSPTLLEKTGLAVNQTYYVSIIVDYIEGLFSVAYPEEDIPTQEYGSQTFQIELSYDGPMELPYFGVTYVDGGGTTRTESGFLALLANEGQGSLIETVECSSEILYSIDSLEATITPDPAMTDTEEVLIAVSNSDVIDSGSITGGSPVTLTASSFTGSSVEDYIDTGTDVYNYFALAFDPPPSSFDWEVPDMSMTATITLEIKGVENHVTNPTAINNTKYFNVDSITEI